MSAAQSPNNLTADKIMISDVVSVTGEMTIHQVIGILLEKKISGAPIVDSMKRVISVASESDLMKLATTAGLGKTLASCLNQLPKDVISVKRQASFAEVYRCFLANPIHRVVVTDDMGKLQGIITRSTVLRVLYGNQPPK